MIESLNENRSKVAIACGGTGGHFFPGVAVAEALRCQGHQVMLLASRKGIDQKAAEAVPDATVRFLPAVGLTSGRSLAFAWGLFKSLALCLIWFIRWKPDAVLIMGGFTSVAPALVGRFLGKRVWLHESNSVPGRANRFLAKCASGVFVGFESAADCFSHPQVIASGTPVRQKFGKKLAPGTYLDWGLLPGKPVLLVMGGSQGAMVLNELMADAAPQLVKRHPELQIIHLTGPNGCDTMQALYRRLGVRHQVMEFCADTTDLIRLATVVLSRSGASSLAEYAAVGLPALLIPYPNAVDDHQKLNAELFCGAGAAYWLDQRKLRTLEVVTILDRLLGDRSERHRMKRALEGWDVAGAASRIVHDMLGSTNAERFDSSLEQNPKREVGTFAIK